MTVIATEVVKYHWKKFRLFVFEITFVVSCTPEFPCVMTMIPDLFIVILFSKLTMTNPTFGCIFKLYLLVFAIYHFLRPLEFVIYIFDILL